MFRFLLCCFVLSFFSDVFMNSKLIRTETTSVMEFWHIPEPLRTAIGKVTQYAANYWAALPQFFIAITNSWHSLIGGTTVENVLAHLLQSSTCRTLYTFVKKDRQFYLKTRSRWRGRKINRQIKPPFEARLGLTYVLFCIIVVEIKMHIYPYNSFRTAAASLTITRLYNNTSLKFHTFKLHHYSLKVSQIQQHPWDKLAFYLGIENSVLFTLEVKVEIQILLQQHKSKLPVWVIYSYKWRRIRSQNIETNQTFVSP